MDWVKNFRSDIKVHALITIEKAKSLLKTKTKFLIRFKCGAAIGQVTEAQTSNIFNLYISQPMYASYQNIGLISFNHSLDTEIKPKITV